MTWTCPHCNESMDLPDTGKVRFCLHCGEPAEPTADAPLNAGRRQGLDRLMRILMVVFGGSWLLLFFVPFGESSYDNIMSWDLLSDKEGMAHIVAWPLVLSLIFLVLGLVRPLPEWLRASAACLLGVAALVVISASDIRGPFGQDLEFVFMGGASWVLMFVTVGAALFMRVRSPKSGGARVLLGVGLLLGLIAYLTEAGGDSTLVGALLYHLKDSSVAQVITRVLMLLPLFILLVATVAFRMPDGDVDSAKPWAKAVGMLMLVYLPVTLLLYGLVTSVAEESGWFLIMFLRLSLYVAGFFATMVVGAAWCADYGSEIVWPKVKEQVNSPGHSSGPSNSE